VAELPRAAQVHGQTEIDPDTYPAFKPAMTRPSADKDARSVARIRCIPVAKSSSIGVSVRVGDTP